MKHVIPALLLCAVCAQAQELPLYYDYVEDGKLMGGKIMIDPNDPVDRITFGLDEPTSRDEWPVTTIVDNGPSSNRIDVVMLGDGYTEPELTDYAQHVNNVLVSFFAEEPLDAYATYFNVHRVDVVSNESGVDEPDNGVYRDTALDMTYNCAGIPRLLCIHVGKALSAAANAPDVDQVFALANSTRYGGAGYSSNDLATLAGNSGSSVEIALHEFGHSFANLADEYHYGDGTTYNGPEPGEPNISIHDAVAQITMSTKWHLWMDLPNVDTYEGAYYHQYDVYRPTYNSKMRSLGPPFEEVNVEQFVINIYKVVSPIDDATPASAEPLSACTTFFVVPLEPADGGLDVQWSVDGEEVPGATGTTFNVDVASLTPGLHDVSVTVVDNTSRVRDEAIRRTWMTESREWTVDVLGVPNECGRTIPAVSEWGLVVMTLLILSAVSTKVVPLPSPLTKGGRSRAIASNLLLRGP